MREQHSSVCRPTVEIMALSKIALGALGLLKGLMDTCVLTDAGQIKLVTTHLLSNKEVSSKFFESARQLSGLKCHGFITEEAYAAQIVLWLLMQFRTL